MYEWIVNGFTSLLHNSRQKSGSRPGNESVPSGAATPSPAQRQNNHISPAKRNYQSIQGPDGTCEYLEIKRPRRDGVVSAVKKRLTAAAGFFRFHSPLTASRSENQKANGTDQVHPEVSSGVNDIQNNTFNNYNNRMELKLENKVETGSNNPEKTWENVHLKAAQIMTKQNVGDPHTCNADKNRYRNPRRSLQLLPTGLPRCGTLLSTENPSGQGHKPCLAVEEDLKESGREQYRLLVEMVSEKYSTHQQLPFSKAKQYISYQPKHLKPVVRNGTCDASAAFMRMRAKPCASVWTDDCMTRHNQDGRVQVNFRSSFKDCEERRVEGQPGEYKMVEDLLAKPDERQASSTSLRVSSDPDNPAMKPKLPVDLDLSAEVAKRLNLVDRELTISARPPISHSQQAAQSHRDSEEFPKFTQEMEQDIRKALGHSNPDTVVSSAFKLRITQRDLSTLRDHSWLNDEVINFYMNLLMTRSEQEGHCKVYAFSTFFFNKLCSGGHQAVRRWTKAVDLFEKDIVLVPLHLGVHWSLAVIDFRVKTVNYYDSMGQRKDDICRRLLHYLKEEFKIKKNKDLEVSKWTVASAKSTRHMPYFRKRMMWEVVNQKLL
ncbi:sentrin-specific protease 2 isoform X2 [Amia ocellicauda]|uniref:sentrin-specific protease 2 isoform X2 n=1 Tax=Amia ocellicauda TaxID=2972642 RepID=UPI003464437C